MPRDLLTDMVNPISGSLRSHQILATHPATTVLSTENPKRSCRAKNIDALSQIPPKIARPTSAPFAFVCGCCAAADRSRRQTTHRAISIYLFAVLVASLKSAVAAVCPPSREFVPRVVRVSVFVVCACCAPGECGQRARFRKPVFVVCPPCACPFYIHTQRFLHNTTTTRKAIQACSRDCVVRGVCCAARVQTHTHQQTHHQTQARDSSVNNRWFQVYECGVFVLSV